MYLNRNIYLSILVVLLILMVPVVYNHGPFIYYDSYDYLSTNTFINPTTHHSLYMLITNYLFSLGNQLPSLIVFFQYTLVILMLGLLAKEQNFQFNNKIFILILIMLPAILILSFQASTLMPDIYLFTAVVSTYFLQYKNKYQWLLSIVLVFSLLNHTAHLFLFIFTLFIERIVLRRSLSRSIIICLVISTTLYGVESLYKSTRGFRKFSPTTLYLASTLAEEGIFEKSLLEICETQKIQLCMFKDKVPTELDALIWSNHSPVSLMHPSPNKYESFRYAKAELDKVIIHSIKYHFFEIVYKLIKRGTINNFTKTFQTTNIIINFNNQLAFPELQKTIIDLGFDKTKQVNDKLDKSYYQYYIISSYLCWIFGLIVYFKSRLENKHLFLIFFLLSYSIIPIISTHGQRYMIKASFCLIPILMHYFYEFLNKIKGHSV